MTTSVKEITQLKFCGGVDGGGGGGVVFREDVNVMQRVDANCCVTTGRVRTIRKNSVVCQHPN
jgi:hypothetical protein